MKSTRLAVAISLAFVLTFLVVGMVTAAPNDSRAGSYSSGSYALYTPITAAVTPTPTVTPPTSTLRISHPVGSAIALYFHIPYTEVMSLHASGIGFGVIARALLTAKELSGTLSFTQVLTLHQSGVGWGQIAKQYGVHPGGLGLGKIMSGHGTPDSKQNSKDVPPGRKPDDKCPGNSCNGPGGGNKHGKGLKR